MPRTKRSLSGSQSDVSPSKKSKPRSLASLFQDAEKELLYQGVSKYGWDFGAIQADPAFQRLAEFPEGLLINTYSRMITRKVEPFFSLHARLSAEPSNASGRDSTGGASEQGSTSSGKNGSPVVNLDNTEKQPVKPKKAKKLAESSGPRAKPFERFNYPIREIIDVEAFQDGSSPTSAQFNVQLSNSRRHWMPRGNFYKEDVRALREFVGKLRLKLRVAEEELAGLEGPEAANLAIRPVKKKNSQNRRRNIVRPDSDSDRASASEEDEEGSVREEYEGVSEPDSESEQSENGSAHEDFDQSDASIATIDLDAKLECNFKAEQDNELSLEEEGDSSEVSSEGSSVVDDAEKDRSESDQHRSHEHVPSPEECIQDLFMTQAVEQGHGEDDNAPEEGSHPASELPISIENSRPPEANEQATKRQSNAEEDLKKAKKSRVIQSLREARAASSESGISAEKCAIM